MFGHLIRKVSQVGSPHLRLLTFRVYSLKSYGPKVTLSMYCLHSDCTVVPKILSNFKVAPTKYNICSRLFSSSNISLNSSQKVKKDPVSIVFVKLGGEKVSVQGKEGDSLLDVVVDNNLDFDGFGACEGTLSCSTCHLIFKQEDYDRLPEKPSDEELDMLDLAYSLTETSRLGCQVFLTKEMDGMEVVVPAGVSDARDTSQASGN